MHFARSPLVYLRLFVSFFCLQLMITRIDVERWMIVANLALAVPQAVGDMNHNLCFLPGGEPKKILYFLFRASQFPSVGPKSFFYFCELLFGRSICSLR